MHGMNTMLPPDGLPPGKFPYAQNVRAYLGDRTAARASQDSSVMTLGASVHSLRRLNDLTPAGPPLGYVLIAGAAGILYANGIQVATGLSGNPLSLIPFRPAASVQPWMYVGDSETSGVYIDSSTGSTLVPNGMLKVRSDGLCYSMGIAEPQAAPTITATPVSPLVSLLGPVNVSIFNFANGDSSGANGTPYIWRNPTDVSGRGPAVTLGQASLSTSGNSLEFDYGVSPNGSYAIPVQWAQYAVGIGSVNTSGVNVTWVSGSQFVGIVAGNLIIINATTYTVAASPAPTNTTLSVTVSAGTQTGVNYYTSVPDGTVTLYKPALSSDGYVFSAIITATLYIPAAGTYTLSGAYVNDIILGIGGSGNGIASWSNSSPVSNAGQTKTVANAYPLLPRSTSIDGNGYSYGTLSVAVTFSQAGNYPIEIDWNYGDDQHASPARTLYLLCNAQHIAPLPGTVIANAQYRYTYRGNQTGATSNPSPPSPEETIAVLANTLSATPSTDPQVNKIDWYRLDAGLTNFTYVGTGPNSSAPFIDSLLDVDVAANPILNFDNYQPFPSIDLPRNGIVNVTGGVATWISGDKFNVRWLPGTVIVVGTVAYTLDKRPTSNIQLTASNVETIGGIEVIVPIQDGAGQVYEIDEPILAAQPLPYLFGPTDNINFICGVGDPLRPGTLYWCKGNNLDSAPDTNQMDVTSPSEVLVNGAMSGGRGVLFSTERAWLILPNFFNALATVQGTVGSTWTLQESSINRGLYIPKALAMEASGDIFFRVKDGVHWSRGGAASQSITDEDIYNLFPHEGQIPQPVTRGTYTVWPPDDTKPQYQSMECANGYLYYDYLDVNGFYRTLVYDIQGNGWVVDAYQYPARIHRLEEGGNVNGTLVGCSDGSVRPLVDSGAEQACAIVLTRCEIAGDVRALKHFGDLYIEAE